MYCIQHVSFDSLALSINDIKIANCVNLLMWEEVLLSLAFSALCSPISLNVLVGKVCELLNESTIFFGIEVELYHYNMEQMSLCKL